MFRSGKISANVLSDEELMRRSTEGDRRAFEALYERYFDKLVWFARRFLQDLQQAEDLVQEVFMKIINKPEAFDPERKFSTWVYTVTSNACRNELRKAQSQPEFLDTDSAAHLHSESSRPNETKSVREDIRKAFRLLNEKEQQVFVLRFEQELSIKEIAEIISIPEGSVKSCLFYLLKKFAKQLKHYQYEG